MPPQQLFVPEMKCFTAGTQIAVPGGSRLIEELEPGQIVQTFDNGPQPLLWVGRRAVSGLQELAPVRFDTGVIGNDRPLLLSQQHRLLVEGEDVVAAYGRPEVLVPAAAFVGLPGVQIVKGEQVLYIHLMFHSHELISAEGVVCESLLIRNVRRVDPKEMTDPTASENATILPGVLAKQLPFEMRIARRPLNVQEAFNLLRGGSEMHEAS